MDEKVLEPDEAIEWIESWVLCQPVKSLTSRRENAGHQRVMPLALARAVAIVSSVIRSRRVCAGSSSSERRGPRPPGGGEGDVFEGGLDVLDLRALVIDGEHGTLVLMEQCPPVRISVRYFT